jgi:hypothetical protein
VTRAAFGAPATTTLTRTATAPLTAAPAPTRATASTAPARRTTAQLLAEAQQGSILAAEPQTLFGCGQSLLATIEVEQAPRTVGVHSGVVMTLLAVSGTTPQGPIEVVERGLPTAEVHVGPTAVVPEENIVRRRVLTGLEEPVEGQGSQRALLSDPTDQLGRLVEDRVVRDAPAGKRAQQVGHHVIASVVGLGGQ